MGRADAIAIAVLLVLVAGATSSRAQLSQGEGPSLALGGDVIFDAPILYAIDRFFGDETAPALEELFGELSPTLHDADLAIVNLECPIAPRTLSRAPEHDAPTFAAPARFADALASAGVDAIVVANNHAYDQGVSGLASTLAEAHRAGLVVVGSGDTARAAERAVIVERGGRRIAIAAFTEGSNRRVRGEEPASPRIAIASEARITESVRAARAGADLVIASLHWTTEIDHDRPTRSMERFARAAAEAGADLVYAHGTHLPGPRGTIETRDGRRVPVLWSLGNLVAAMEEPDDRIHDALPSVRDALLARVRTREAADGRLEVSAIEAEPFWIGTAQRAWWGERESSPMVRPLSIAAELARLGGARCGARCDRFAESYRARERMLAGLFAEPVLASDPAPVSDTGSGSAPATASEPVSAPRRPRLRTSPDVAPPIPPDLARGVALRIRFGAGAAIESELDRDQLRVIASILRADRSVRVDLVARSSRDEHAAAPSLALRRAHRARGLIAILGPSRDRITLREDEPADAATVIVRLVRPP